MNQEKANSCSFLKERLPRCSGSSLAKNGFAFISFLVLLAAPFLELRSQTFPPKISSYGPEEYGGHHQIFSVEPLSNGKVVLGTMEEALIHSGEGFHEIPIEAGKYITSIDRSPSGRIYLGGNGLMGFLDIDRKGSLFYRSILDLLTKDHRIGVVQNVWCKGDEKVFFNTQDRLFRYDGDSLIPKLPKARYSKLHTKTDPAVIEDEERGLIPLGKGPGKPLKGTASFGRERNSMAVLPSGSEHDTSWSIFTRKGGFFEYSLREKELTGPLSLLRSEDVSLPEEVRISDVADLDPTRNPFAASYAVATPSNGIYLLEGDRSLALHLDADRGLPSQRIWETETDEKGNLWLGTDHGIALLHIGIPFTVAKKGEMFNGSVSGVCRPFSDRTNEMEEDPSLFMSTLQGGWRWDRAKNAFTRLSGTEGQCMDLLPFEHPNGERRILFAGNKVLSSPLFPNDEPRGQKGVDTIGSHQAYALSKTPLGKGHGIVQAGSEGVFVLRPERIGKAWKTEQAITELPEGVNSISLDRSFRAGDSLRIWCGMPSEGVLEILLDTSTMGHELRHHSHRKGLPKGEVAVLSHPLEESVLFGTSKGLYRYDQGEFEPYCAFGKAFCKRNTINRLVKGNGNELWVSGPNGWQVARVEDPKGEPRIDSTNFRSLDLGAIWAIKSEKERIFMGGNKGMAIYHPTIPINEDPDWKCHIQRVIGTGDSLLFGGAHYEVRKAEREGSERIPSDRQAAEMVPELPYSKNRLKFFFAAPCRDHQEAVEYRYRLSGSGEDRWSDWKKAHRKEYTNLPIGSYSFEVQARNLYLQKSEKASYRFRILTPWYRTWSAYTTYSLAAGLILMLGFRSYVSRLKRQNERLEEMVKERTLDIQAKNEALETEKERVEKAHQEIQESIDFASTIQQAVLHSEEPVTKGLPEHFILFKPYSQVSGDFHWGKVHRGHLYAAAVDCTGHGVPGAMMSMLGISFLNDIMTTEEFLEPARILDRLKERLIEELSGVDHKSGSKSGMDASMVRIPLHEGNEKEVLFAGANLPCYVVQKGIGERDPSTLAPGHEARVQPFPKDPDGVAIKEDPMPVGYFEYASDAFRSISLRLQKGQMIYLFSDGFADQFGGPKGKKFRYGPFKRLLASLHQKPLKEQKEELSERFEDWKAESGQEQIDDVLVIGIRL